jgi:hypothetical protein
MSGVGDTMSKLRKISDLLSQISNSEIGSLFFGLHVEIFEI